MDIGMRDEKDENVEELAEALESRISRKEEPDGLEEIELEDFREEGELEEEIRRDPYGKRDSGNEVPGNRGKKNIPEDEFMEDDWGDEDTVPMKPWVMAAIMAGLIVLAAIICAVLWHFTHLEREEGDGNSQQSASVSVDDTASSPSGSGELPGSIPDEGIASGETAFPETPTPVPAASPAPTLSPTPAVPQTTIQPGTQTSTAVQEPVSGTTAMEFTQSNDEVTPKDVINLRSEPSTFNADNIVIQAKNGEVLSRTGVNEATGWSRIDHNGETLYAVSQYLTTDLSYKTPVQTANPNRVNTMDGRIILFTDCDDNITPKEYVNLRTEPSTSEGETTVRCQISNGEVVHRTGYSPDAGWSRVEYNGEVLYVVSSYMYTVQP